MLDLFTKSKIRKKIILLFIYNQGKEFYLSGIAKRIGTTPGTAQRELNRILQNDLILIQKRGGLNLYSINKQYPLLKEVEAIVKKTVGVEEELKRELRKINDLSFAFIFGSYVKGGFKSNSDIDLFVIGKMNEDKIFKAVQKVEKLVSRSINYHISDVKEFAGKLDTDYFYKDILKNNILLIGDKHEFKALIR